MIVFDRLYLTLGRWTDTILVSFEIESPAPARIVVTARSYHPRDQDYYDELLTELERYYPEVREARVAETQARIEAEIRPATEARTTSSEVPATTPTGSESVRPWEMIPDVGNNRMLLQLWHEKYPVAEIATRIGARQPKTVYNRVTELRKLYGEDIVPRRR
jgi:hypothetical protein